MADDAPDWAKDDAAPDWAKEAPAPAPAASAPPAAQEPGTLSKIGSGALSVATTLTHPFGATKSIVDAGKAALDEIWEREKKNAAATHGASLTDWTKIPGDIAGAISRTAEPITEPLSKIAEGAAYGPAHALTGAIRTAGEPIAKALNPNAKLPSHEDVYSQVQPEVMTALGLAMPTEGMPLKIGLGGAKPPAAPSVPAAPVRPPFGLTLTKGEESGDLALRGKEQAAARGEYGPEAQTHAQNFSTQREGQLGDVKDQLPNHLDAAQTVGRHLTDTAGDQAANEAQLGARLDAEHESIRTGLGQGRVIAQSPQEAADVIGASVTRAEEQARAARDAAYEQHNKATGTHNPTVFANAGRDVRASLSKGTDPVVLDSKRTPVSIAAIRDLDTELGAPARAALDPKVKSFKPFTPQRVEDVRKRLVSFSRQANDTARATQDYSDVRAMGRVTDAFDQIVNRSLRNPKTFSGGNGVQIANDIEAARALHSDLRSTFSGRDPVGKTMQSIVGRGDQSMSSNDIRKSLYGNGEKQVQMGRRMVQLFGDQSPEVGALKQGLLSHATEEMGPTGRTLLAPEQRAQAIRDLVDGNGRELAQTYFNPNEQNRLRAYADRLHRSVAPPPVRTDIVSRTLDKITGAGGGQGYDAHQMDDLLFGRSGIGENPDGAKMIRHIRDTYGADSEPFGAVRGGMVSKLFEGTPAQVVKKIEDHLNGAGRPTSELLYSAPQREILERYQDTLRKMILPKGQYFPSAPPIVRAVNALTGKVAAFIGAAVVRTAFPFAPLGAEVAGYAGVHAASRALQLRQARKIMQQMPMVGDAMRRWQVAVARAQGGGANTSPLAINAALNLGRSLKPLGINLMHVAAGIWDQATAQSKQSAPRGENKNNNKSEIPQRAHGGRVGDPDGIVSTTPRFSPESLGARQAPDGEWYLDDQNRPGKYLRVVQRSVA